MCIAKEKNRYSECYTKVLYAGPKSARNILTDFRPNSARPEKPGPNYNSALKYVKYNLVPNITFDEKI